MWSQSQQLAGCLLWAQESGGRARLPLTPFPWPTDLFFSMAGLTSSVASALSELSLSDVDLGTSVHSNMASRRLSAQGPPTGEFSRGRKSWKKAWCRCHLCYVHVGGLQRCLEVHRW